MCCIIIRPPGIELPEGWFAQAWQSNSHGGGLMYAKDNKLHFFKTMKESELLAEYNAAPKDVTVFLHFRLATHGSRGVQGCHPHEAAAGVMLMHNGIISGIAKGEDSDSAMLGKILGRFTAESLFMDAMRALVESLIGHNNKVVWLHRDGRFCILNRMQWEEAKGLTISNRSCIPWVRPVRSLAEYGCGDNIRTVTNKDGRIVYTWDYTGKKRRKFKLKETDFTKMSMTKTRFCPHCHAQLYYRHETALYICRECVVAYDLKATLSDDQLIREYERMEDDQLAEYEQNEKRKREVVGNMHQSCQVTDMPF